jgi:hypothetical protein
VTPTYDDRSHFGLRLVRDKNHRMSKPEPVSVRLNALIEGHKPPGLSRQRQMECIGEVHACLKPVESGRDRVCLFDPNLWKPGDVSHALGHSPENRDRKTANGKQGQTENRNGKQGQNGKQRKTEDRKTGPENRDRPRFSANLRNGKQGQRKTGTDPDVSPLKFGKTGTDHVFLLTFETENRDNGKQGQTLMCPH